MNIEQISYEEASGEMLDYFSKEQLAGYLERCLSKLAEQAVEPVAIVDVMCDACSGSGYDKKDSNYGCAECNSTGFVQRRLYTEAQYLAAQQRTAEALIEPMAEAIYKQWCFLAEYKAWVDGGNSIKQDEARLIARLVVDSGDWRE